MGVEVTNEVSASAVGMFVLWEAVGPEKTRKSGVVEMPAVCGRTDRCAPDGTEISAQLQARTDRAETRGVL
jgi:hypothetical protein